MILARLALGSFLAAAVGLAALRAFQGNSSGESYGAPNLWDGKGWKARSSSLFRVTLGAMIGLSMMTLIVFALGVSGLPVRGRGIVSLEVLLTAGLFLASRRRVPSPGPLLRPSERVPFRRRSDPLSNLSAVVLGAALLVSGWKWFAVPLWSWDHYAIWGMKAKRIIQDHILDFGFLQLSAFSASHSDYPVGLPLACRILIPGAEPDETAFRLFHLLWLLAVIVVLREGVRETGGSLLLANSLASFVAVSPLFWDTEVLGIADPALGLFALAAAVVAIKCAAGSLDVPAWACGLLIGFLSWIKREGMLLGALVLLAGLLLMFRRPRSGGLKTTVLMTGVATALFFGSAFASLALPRGFDFFAEDWAGRGLSRLRESKELLAQIFSTLVRLEWLGFWIFWIAALLVALAKRKRTASVIGAVVVIEIVSYAAVYFMTALDPISHLHASFFRLTAALVPLAALAVAALFRDEREASWSEQL